MYKHSDKVVETSLSFFVTQGHVDMDKVFTIRTNKFNSLLLHVSMVSTQPTNKDAHSGYRDLPNPQHKQSKPKSANVTLIQQEHAIQNITAIEQDLLTMSDIGCLCGKLTRH